MKALIVCILFVHLLGGNLFSQQCSYGNYHLFVLQVQKTTTGAKVPDLKMHLVDEQERPVLTSVTYFEDNQWKYRSDTLFFWEHIRLKQAPGTSPLFRQKYFNLGDYYVVAFSLDLATLKDPETYPIYKVKIDAGSNVGLKETMLVHLPLQKAVRICNNGITSDFPLVKPVQTLDGKDFEPINIVLGQPEKAIAVAQPKDALRYAVRFDYQTQFLSNVDLNEYLLDGARIYDTQTGKLHQEIYIPRISKSPWKESRNIVKFIDFYNRGITEAQDFSVQIESWRDLELKGYRQKLNYYIFNTTTKQYELDTTLSNYNDVFYHEPLKTMRRYDYQATSKSRIAYTYQLENKKWVLIDRNEVFFEPIPPKIKFPSSNCIVASEKSHTLPLKAMIGIHAKVLVKDTFWLYNTCEDTLFITQVQSASRDFFSINPTLLPKQYTPLIFNGFLSHESYAFSTHQFYCILILTDGSITGFGIDMPTVSNHAIPYYRADSSISYVVSNPPNARFSTAVFTYSSGHIRAKGTVQDRDTSLKVGNWLYFKEGTLNSDQVTYSKAMVLSAFDDTYGNQHNQFKVKVLENGIWQEPIMDAYNNEIRFYVSPETDSVIAYTDTTRYGFGLSYKKLQTQTQKQFYLLKPAERTLKVGYYEMPFHVVKDQYAILLNYGRFKSANRTTYELTDSIITELQKQYPGITTVWISKHQRGINLEGLEYETRGKVLQQLAKDSSVAFICQLFYTLRNQQRLTYCDNKAYAEIDIQDAEKFRKRALKLGFSGIEIDSGNNRFWLTYPGKFIDEGFFEAFDRLTQEKLVFRVDFNVYFEPELDHERGD